MSGPTVAHAENPTADGISIQEMAKRSFLEVFVGNAHPPLRTRMGDLEDRVGEVEGATKCLPDIRADMKTISRVAKYILAPLMVTIAVAALGLLWAVLTHSVAIVAATSTVVP